MIVMPLITGKRGQVIKFSRSGIGILEDLETKEQFGFTFDKIKGYGGEYPEELGLRVGSEVSFDAGEDGVVVSVALKGR